MQDDLAYLPDLICFRHSVLWLQVDDFSDSGFRIHVMAASNPFRKTHRDQHTRQFIEPDIVVGSATQNGFECLSMIHLFQ